MKDPLRWLLLLAVATGALVGCVQSANWIGAAVWMLAVCVFSLLLAISR